MEEFLMSKAKEALKDNWIKPHISYVEDINEDAESDAWLKNGTSYIWKVGVLAIIDGNKADWAYLYIGHQRDPRASYEFIGRLYWSDGENDDPGRCLERYIECAKASALLFDKD